LDIRIIIKLHEFVRTEQTGTPKELAYRLEISIRTLYNYLSFMKTELNAPLLYNTTKGTYCYIRVCELCFEG